MNLVEKIGGFFVEAEPSYSPLGLAPYDAPKTIFGRSRSEYAKSMVAIDDSIDRYVNNPETAELPYHVDNAARQILYETLARQAMRNMIPHDSPIGFDAKRSRLSPSGLVGLMHEQPGLRAVEIARNTHFGIFDVDKQIHIPVAKSLMDNPALDTVELHRRREIKTDYRPEEGIMKVEFMQARWKHFRGAMTTNAFWLAIIDMRTEQGQDLFMASAEKTLLPGHHRAANVKIGEHVVELAQHSHDPELPVLYPSLDTYFTLHPRRLLSIADDRHRKVNPNL